MRAVSLSLAGLGCVAAVLVARPLRADTGPACTESGIASFYGPGFYGRPTASGEIFDASAMTAAHRTLPLGTTVEVTDVESGARVTVTVNDRGPYIDGRIIDLSEGAARALGIIRQGIVEVTVAIYARDQADPTLRLAAAALEGLPTHRPALLRAAQRTAIATEETALCP